MQRAAKEAILRLLDEHRIMTVATVRPDGWPQATTVGYANDGLRLYFLCSPQSQKAANISADNRISLTIDHDVTDPMRIEGLSMAARAFPMDDADEIRAATKRLLKKFPEYESMQMPDPSEIEMVKVIPEVISLLDYRKGFGHSDLLTVTAKDLAA